MTYQAVTCLSFAKKVALEIRLQLNYFKAIFLCYTLHPEEDCRTLRSYDYRAVP